jgi:DNA-binding MarR family transcriptional regulator
MDDGKFNENLASLAEIDRNIHEPARLMVMAWLSVVESADFTFLMNQTGLTWGNLSAHLGKLEDAGYISVEKTFRRKRPNTMLQLTDQGRQAFQAYLQTMKQVLNNLPAG